MDPALLLTKQKGNSALLDQLKNIWLSSREKPGEYQATPVSRDKVLELKGILGRFATCTQGFQEELAALKQTVVTYVNREHPARPLNVLIAANPGSRFRMCDDSLNQRK